MLRARHGRVMCRPCARVVGIGAVCLWLTLVTADPSAASGACRVTNTTSGGTYQSLAAAVRAARNGNSIVIRGTCLGSTEIVNKRLTVAGRWTRKYGTPTLGGGGRQAVLMVGGDFAKVTVKGLTIEAKPDSALRRRGGIRNELSTLALQDVKIRGFKTREDGGGIANFEGTVRLLGTTRVVNNESARSGGGIYNNSGSVILDDRALVAFNSAREGGGISSVGTRAVVLRGASSVRDNTATDSDGGGIRADHGPVTLSGNASISGNATFQYGGGYAGSGVLTMAGEASIAGNTAEVGGGVYSGGDIVMSATSTVTGNIATVGSGGVDHRYGTRSGIVCDPEPNANVFGNSPNDCNLQ